MQGIQAQSLGASLYTELPPSPTELAVQQWFMDPAFYTYCDRQC